MAAGPTCLPSGKESDSRLDAYLPVNLLWCRWQESDLRPDAYETSALPLSYIGNILILIKRWAGEKRRSLPAGRQVPLSYPASPDTGRTELYQYLTLIFYFDNPFFLSDNNGA